MKPQHILSLARPITRLEVTLRRARCVCAARIGSWALVCGLAILSAGCSKQSPAASSVGQLSPAEPGKGVKTPINLSRAYNAGHQTNWMGGGKVVGRDLAELPEGMGTYGGVLFNVGGVVQLRGLGDRPYPNMYPESVDGIRIGVKCSKLHFLHATAWSTATGTRIASYNLHYSDGTVESVPVLYGNDLRDYTYEPSDVTKTNGAAWSSLRGRYPKRIFRSTWVNPKPSLEVKSLDFVSTGSRCYPFLLAITAE